MKAAPVFLAMRGRPAFAPMLVHTGQHYDAQMSDVFFRQLGLPPPDVNLEVGSGSHAVQTAETMMRFEKFVLEHKPDWTCVYGDVNSTVACALVAAKLGVHVAHVEAGLRSRDWGMPEEVNRVVTDRLSDLLFTTSSDADRNLAGEGVPAERIHFVGNCMIDTLVRLLPRAERPPLAGLDGRFVLVTLHRPSNVDEPDMLGRILAALESLPSDTRVVFPVHPRTRQRMKEFGVLPGARFIMSDPLGYFEFLWLQKHAFAVVTDSGGVQEETTYLGTPCFTLRDNTERPVTCEVGSNVLVGRDPERLRGELAALVDGRRKASRIPPLWDGRAAERIVDFFARLAP